MEEQFVDNNGVRIHFRTVGKGPLLILQHGFPDNALAFDFQAKELAKDYTVVCPTLRGYPPSDIPDDSDAYDLMIVASDFVAILDRFGVDKAFVGGHDFGGAAMQTFAFLHPERVHGLILINSPIVPAFHDLVNFDSEQQRLSEYTIPYMHYQPGDPKNAEFIVRHIRNRERRQEILDYLTTSPMHGMLNYYKKNYPAPPYGHKVDTTMMLYQIPTLIVWGLEEEYFALKQLDGLPKYFLESLRVVLVPGAGHWSFHDKPAVVSREIQSWLSLMRSEIREETSHG
jgi:pimeloyl-ACP methyl ester carboxylesterase